MDNAIACHTQAVDLTPDGHPDKPGFLNNLGSLWQRRFERLGELTDVDNAIACQTHAVGLTPDGHSDKPVCLTNLGNSHLARYKSPNRLVDLELACAAFERAAISFVVNPRVQLDCARKWAITSLRLNLSPLEAFRTAFALLPSLVWLGQTTQARYLIISSISDLVPAAAAWAVSVESYDLALEWLEQGSSVIWRQMLQLRTPFDDLAAVDPELSNKLKDTASQLDIAGSSTSAAGTTFEPVASPESQVQRHHSLALRWEELLTQARRLPGFCDFLLPTKAQILKQAARDGPIVMINTHSTRCDALIILPQAEDIIHVPLPRFSEVKLTYMRTQCAVFSRHGGEVHPDRGVTNRTTQDVFKPLASLWSDVVEPVLRRLSYINKGTLDALPHVTWCATGALSFLPLHAAGLYDGQSPNTFDLVVSSYTPTIGALLSPVEQEPELRSGLLAVGQDATLGLFPLPNTVEELKVIEKYISPSHYNQLTGGSATVAATLDAMEAHSWVHFACHATQNRFNPHHSAFCLHDGKLTLAEIAKRAFKNKGLAFLSACQTAAGDHDLPNEATHLAAGMLTAGYRSVIAALWSIKDDDAPVVAEGVYAELTRNGKMDHAQAARALHKAVGTLRKEVGVRAVERWAPFIHMGL
ncbi:hypothetical protein FRC07_006328 [Ceratobasidium sp. 392]|nr:hypothetical protein FRC07_006328 [Ceratobasidium sp. 392]